jgi:hypothetical protein
MTPSTETRIKEDKEYHKVLYKMTGRDKCPKGNTDMKIEVELICSKLVNGTTIPVLAIVYHNTKKSA